MGKNGSKNAVALKLRLITENLNDLVTVVNQKGQIEYINENTHKKTMGYSFSDLKSKNAFELVHPEEKNRVISSFNDCFEKGEGTVEARILHKNGEYIWIETNAKSFIDNNEEMKILTIGRDITERKKAEKRIRDSEEKYRLLLENAQEGIWAIDTDATVTYANERMAEMLGYTVEEIIGTHLFEYMSEESTNDAKMQLDRRSRGIKDKILRKFVRKDGSEIITSLETSPMMDEQGKYIGAIACVIDITESKMAEEKLKESEERYRYLIEQAAMGIAHVAPNGRFLRINQKLCDILKYSREELQALTFPEITHPEDLEENLDALNKLINGKLSQYNTEKRYISGEGSLVWGSLTVSTKRNIRNEIEYFISVIEDISERKTAEQKLEESEERYRYLIENTSEGVWVIDSNAKTILVNPSMANYLGYTIDEMLGRSVYSFMDKSEAGNTRSHLEKRKQGVSEVRDAVFNHKNGKKIFLRIRGSPIFDSEGHYEGTYAFLSDVTEQKLAERKLKESEEKYRLLFEGANDAIFLLDKYSFIDMNDYTLSMFKFGTKSDLIGIKPWEVSPLTQPDGRNSKDAAKEFINKCLEGEPQRFYWKHTKKDGTSFDAEISLNRIFIEDKYFIQAIVRDITEQTIAEQKLKESEEKFRRIAEQSLMGICIAQDNRIVYLNQAYADIWGYTVEEMTQWGLSDVVKAIHPDDRAFTLKQLAKKQKGEKDITANYQYRGIKKTGETIWLENFSRSIIYNNKPADFITVFDITEKKETEQKLRESEEKYRSLFENMNAGFAYHEVIVDDNNIPIDYKFLEVNPAFEKLTGLNKEALIGNKVTEAIPGTENDPADWIGKYGNVGLTGIPLTIEEYSEAIGKWYKVSGYSPKKGFFAVTFTDITERKKAELKLRESEEKYRNLFENSPYYIIMLDSSGKVVDCNPATEKILGYTREDFIDRNFQEFVKVPANRQLLLERFTIVMRGEKLDPIEILFSKKDGTPIWVRTIGTLFKIGEKAYINIIGQDITNQKLSRQKLKESEQKFKNISDQALMGISIIQDDVIKYENQRMADIFGYSIEEALSWKPYEYLKTIAPESLDIVKERARKKQEGDPDVTIHYELKGLTKSGEKIWLENFSKTIEYEGRPADLITLLDITEKKKAEQKLKESEEKFRNIADQSFMGIYILVDSVFKYLNQAVVDIIGLTVDEVLNFSRDEIARYIHPEDYHLVSDTHRRIIEGESVEPYESRVIHKSGEIKWIESYSRKMIYDGKPAILTSIVDITRRKEAEEKIKESEEKFRSITEESLLGICIIQDNVIKYVNQEMAELYGYPTEEMLAWEPSELLKTVAPSSLELVKEQLKKKQAGDPNVIVHYPIQCVKKNGEHFWVDNISKTMTYEGRPADLVTQVDITRQKKAEEELIKLTDLKSELLRRTSHELKTPLVSIKGYTELLEIMHGKKLDYEAIEIIEEIKQGCYRLENLITDILKTSELESGTIELKKTQENIVSVIELAARELQGLTKLRKHEIVLNLDENITIAFEREQIHQVISNLLNNAIKYTPPNGKIEVKTRIEGNFVKVSVKDNGIGITSDEMERIFQQFGKIERYGRGFDVISEGSGLGLYNAKKIIELHGGEIWVESEGREKGSTFNFTLPLLG